MSTPPPPPPPPLPNALTLDAALATALETSHGLDLSTPEWSAAALRTPHGRAAIRAVHEAYFRAGAEVATTATYQVGAVSERDGAEDKKDNGGNSEDDNAALIRTAVRLAHEARERVLAERAAREEELGKRLFVAGSLGPYGACLADGSEYTGAYGARVGAAELRAFHRGRIGALVGAGVDLLALETVPCAEEVAVVVRLLEKEFCGVRAWVGLSVRERDERDERDERNECEQQDDDDDAIVLADGSPLAPLSHLLTLSPSITAFGPNCIAPHLVTRTLRILRRHQPHSDARTTRKPLLCYPNSGETWDAAGKAWRGSRGGGAVLAERVREWWGEGARWVGGCCRTGAEEVRVVGRVLGELGRGEGGGEGV
ncbi:uncharacterized protein K452DRAFT_263836 [Aplosporella prunicola CBS 121167]|uniref:Hcy-binding domain-containing protein n=1 Tax=Aplosporella prunicola CBS 121167 TaxID=1176127 RepID=A0A6A6BPY0_9PEZI|nr:uncharacterized protein K452DRAFT_263836 [Aplosporella prunicola CBS 121167]KAF2146199.1 hypothetical protein K452DRAFT_263836 [Aplosporella prunicola CBS 121167]